MIATAVHADCVRRVRQLPVSSRLLILAPRLHKARSIAYELSSGGDNCDVLVVVVVQ